MSLQWGMPAKLSIKDMRELAAARGGKCLSDTYVNAVSKLEWQCKKGHTWKATPNSIKNGNHWCPNCHGTKKKSIEDMQRLAADRGGKCLSSVYVNQKIKLQWQCRIGHTWLAVPNSIANGHWCPACVGRCKTITEMQNHAETRGGKCLSKKYVNSSTKLEWQCAKGHVWSARPSAISSGSWCPDCGGKKAKTIEQMQTLAAEHGGRCLSDTYVNISRKLKWSCSIGHEWLMTPATILHNNSWCPECAGRANRPARKKARNLKIEDMRDSAINRGGLCLSENYVNLKTPLLWQCSRGHKWTSAPSNILYANSWCPVCAGTQRKSLSFVRELASKRGGRCLSNQYLGMSTVLEWECKEGHRWGATPQSISRGSWCASCLGIARKTVSDMVNLAKSYGGSFLSTKYKSVHDKYLWQCEIGHKFKKKAHDVANGSWCPSCADKLSERLTRAIFESIFNEEFPTRRPSWLRNSRGNRMELDGFCEKLGLAFEYQGIQHYQKSHFFHKSEQEFKQRYADDELKARLCEKSGVNLFRIPYKLNHDKIGIYVIKECKKIGVTVNPNWSFEEVDLSTAYSPKTLDELKLIARERDGICLSDRYVNATSKMQWKCKNGHVWYAPAHRIRKGHWCPECSGNKRKTIEDMHELAERKKGKFVSKEFTTVSNKHIWECSEGHRWNALPSNIQTGSWCPVCARNYRRKIPNNSPAK